MNSIQRIILIALWAFKSWHHQFKSTTLNVGFLTPRTPHIPSRLLYERKTLYPHIHSLPYALRTMTVSLVHLLTNLNSNQYSNSFINSNLKCRDHFSFSPSPSPSCIYRRFRPLSNEYCMQALFPSSSANRSQSYF